jgi:hypothetical protein
VRGAAKRHRTQLYTHEKCVECIRAIKERVVLQTDMSAMLEKRLEALIVVVQIVFTAEQCIPA